MKIINKKKFAKTTLDKNVKVFIIYIISFNLSLMLIYIAQKTQIILLITKKIKILIKYLNYLDIFYNAIVM